MSELVKTMFRALSDSLAESREHVTSVKHRNNDVYGQLGFIDIVFQGEKYTVQEPTNVIVPCPNDDLNRRWALKQILLGTAKKV